MDKRIAQIVKSTNASPVYEVCTPTRILTLAELSQKLDNTIYLKREDETSVKSFKIRGAYHKIRSLKPEVMQRGIICASAGNHAQGVAISARELGIPATVVMTHNAPDIKVAAVKNLGANVILHGEIFDEANTFALEYAKQHQLSFIPPYDDEAVIAGQGTVGKELLEQLDTIDAVFLCVGGGGLISGVASYLKTYKPEIKIISVEPEDSATLHTSLAQQKRVILEEVGTFADGVAVKQLGVIPFELLQQGLVDETITVTNDEICAAIKDIYNDTRAIAEPAGALGIAGIKKYTHEHNVHNQHLVALLSGGNVNFDRLRYISERADIGEKSEAIFAATIDERPGSFLEFCSLLSGYSVTEFNYRYSSNSSARIFVGVGLKEGETQKQAILTKLSAQFAVIDLSENAIAKTHIRYMVGGKAETGSELLYRFEFPERKGALLKFLQAISGQFNISLFHYRNHGSAYGRVLVGFQTSEQETLESVLSEIGYIFHNETDNIAYQYFL